MTAKEQEEREAWYAGLTDEQRAYIEQNMTHVRGWLRERAVCKPEPVWMQNPLYIADKLKSFKIELLERPEVPAAFRRKQMNKLYAVAVEAMHRFKWDSGRSWVDPTVSKARDAMRKEYDDAIFWLGLQEEVEQAQTRRRRRRKVQRTNGQQ